MALNQSQLEQLLSTVKKTGTNAVPNFASAAVDTKQNSIDSLTKQISNTSTRLAAVGEDATKIADTRNPLEKILNLTPDQSFIFDIFELINRPQQALFGAIEEGASGGNALEGAIGGLTGNKDTNFKEVLQSVTKSDLGDVKGQLDLIDVVGFAGDVFLDPADLSLMMVTGGTSLAGSIASGATDAAKIAGEGVDIAKAAEAGLDIAQEATKGAKSLGVLQDVVFGKGKRLATNLSLEDYVSAVLSNKARTKLGLEGASMTSMTMKSMGGAIKGMSAFGDAAFTHGFKMLDSTGTLSDAYSGLKKGFEQVASDSGRSIKRQIGLAQEKFNTTMLMLRGVDTRYIQWLDKVAKENLPEGADLLQFKGELNIKFLDLFEHKYADNLLNADTVLGFMTNKTHSLPYSEDTINHLFEVFGKENIEPYMTVSQFQNGAKYLEFDSNVFNLDENYDFVQGLRLKAEKYTTVFDDKTRKAYEKTLKYSDPVRYSQYQQAVKNYEDGLGKRVAERFEKETGLEPKSTDFNSPKWKEMQKKVEADDIKLTKYRTEQSATNAIVHPQTMLQDPSMIKERYNVWLTKEERKAHLAAMTPEDAKSYRKYIREAMKASGGDADTVERIYIEGDKMLRNAKKVVSTMSDLEDVAYSSKLNDAYRQGRIKMGQYGNEATDAYYAKLAADPVVVEGAAKFKETMHEAQRAVGWREFKDEEALIRMGYEGYATHGINQSIVDAFEEIKQKHPEWADKIDFSVFMPGKTRALAARQTYGTTYETNMFLKEWYGKMFGDDAWVKEQFKDADEEFLKDIQKAFTENNMLARESTASLFSFMDDSYSAINKNNKTNQVLLAHTFGNPKAQGAAFQAIGSGDEVPLTHTLMKEKDVRKTITTLEANIKVAGENAYTRSLINELKSTLNKGGNRVPIMEKHVYERLVHVNEISPKKAIAFIDAINSGFKIGKTLNPAFNVKNVTGHLVNQWLAGVPMSQIIPNWNAAFRMRKEMSLIDNKIIEGGIASLTKGEIDLFDTYQEFLDAGFMTRSSVYRLNDLDPNARWTDPMSSKKNFDSIYNNFMTRGNMQGNLVMDNTARLSTYLYAKSHPEFIKKLGIDIAQPDAAMQAVRLVHFDPNDLTFFEDDVMKRLVPFYTFTRQNMAFQIKNLTRHSERYNKLFKAYNSWNTNVMDLASGDMQQYQRDQFYVPVWKKENGEYVMVKTSLPVAALTEFSMDAQQTAQNIVSKTTPLVRMPFEAATGVQTFTGQPIERYAGELSTRIPLPGMTKSMEWLWSQTGWDAPAATLVQTGKAAYNVATGQSVGTEIEKALNLYSSVNPQDAQLSKLYSTIESLSAREKVLKSKGVEIPTLDAIQSASANNKLSVQSAQLQKITDLINNIKR